MANLPGKFVWFECHTSDVARAKTFYGEVLGWKTEAVPMGEGINYEMILAGGQRIGGFWTAENGTPPHWTSYLSVEDVNASARKAGEAGGKILAEPADYEQAGRMARLADPQGAEFWIIRATEDAPDAPPSQGRFWWNELWARDEKKALAFYHDVFGYTVKDTPMAETVYHVLEKDGVQRAGIMKAPMTGVPTMWLPYIAVDDCDGTVARARRLAGTVRAPPDDIPTVGRFSILSDPMGATFAVIKPAQP